MDNVPIDREAWRRSVARAWRTDSVDAMHILHDRLLRVESCDGAVVSSGKFRGAGYPDEPWVCINAAPAVKWMDGQRWRKVKPELERAGFSWQWL